MTRTDRPVLRESAVELEIPFQDLDPLGVVWHGNYLRYFEAARQRLFDDSGLDLYGVARAQDAARGVAPTGFVFPVVKTSLKYVQPLRFRERIRVLARLAECRRRIALEFEIRKLPDGTLCTRGRSEQVAIRLPELTLELDIPPAVRRALEGSGAP